MQRLMVIITPLFQEIRELNKFNLGINVHQ